MCNRHQPPNSRRRFLASSALTAGGLVGGIPHLAFGDPDAVNEDLLVVVFLRGGIDGLSLVLPVTGPDRGHYEAARPRLRIPVSGTGAALPLGNFLGLHPAAGSHAGPSAASLYDYYNTGKLAIVHACGLDHPTRSHFDAQSFMELGTPGSGGTSAGWLARHFQSASNLPPDIIMPTLAVGSNQQACLLGSLETINMEDADSFALDNIGHWEWRQAQRVTLRQMIENDNDTVHQTSAQALDAVGIIETYVSGDYTPANGAVYPNNGFGEQMALIARLAKLGLGLRGAAVDFGGWDTHDGQATGSTGFFANQVTTLSQGLAALYQDLDGPNGVAQRMTVVVMSEFGRRLRENDDSGTDHGHGNVMLVMGGKVNGGVHGTWPGLANNQLYDGADLAITTDYRRVLTEILIRRMGNNRVDLLFPGYSTYAPLNVVQGIDLPPWLPGTVFMDGFESGDASRWTRVIP
jgi:uncharacterized protein (DUF1501 family)